MRSIRTKFRSLCHGCKDSIAIGVEVLYDETAKKVYHPGCVPPEQGDLLGASDAEQLADKLGFSRE